ncbi:hypothetical protein GCAAIG_06245 [Candidatus Electronema halotolerans]
MLKVKYLFSAAAVLLGLRPAAAAIKSCAELQAEIEAKLAAKKVKAYCLTIVEKEEEAQGKTVGSCENSSKKIMYIRQGNAPAEPSGQSQSAKNDSAGDADWPVMQVCSDQLIATAGGQEKVVFSCGDGSRPVDQDSAVEEALAKVTAQSIKPCPELKAEIEAKLKAHKVKAYTLNIVSKNADAPGKVVGTCENSSKKIMYIRK